MTQHTVYIGSPNDPLFTITNDLITDVRGEFNCKMVATEMPVDYFEVDFEMAEESGFYTSLMELFETSDGKTFFARSYPVRDTALRTPIWYFQDETCIAHMFLDDLKQTGPGTFYLKAVSFLSILDGYNRTYAYQNNTFGVILNRIILTTGANTGGPTDQTLQEIRDMLWFESDDLRDTHAQFFLPQCSRREALMQFLLSCDLIIRPWTEGRYLITRPAKSNAPQQIPSDNVYASPDAEYTDAYDRVEVFVHDFIDLHDPSETVYETPDGAPETERVVFFDEPVVMSTISTTGSLVIIGKTEGGITITGKGTVTARKYRHYSWVVARGADSAAAKKILSIDNDICITPEVGEYCADNLWNYYSSGVNYNMDAVMSGESCGIHYAIPTPFSRLETAHLEQVRFVGSELTKGTCRFKPNYSPPSRSKTAVLLTGSGVFRVPDYVFEQPNPKITVTLVGGGCGGWSGYKGFPGEKGKQISASAPNAVWGYGYSLPKPGGLPGDGGRILSFEITGDSLRRSYAFSCGAGGSGASPCDSEDTPNRGADGGDTTFGEYSSVNGYRNSAGAVNISNDERYGGKLTEYVPASQLTFFSCAGGVGSVQYPTTGAGLVTAEKSRINAFNPQTAMPPDNPWRSGELTRAYYSGDIGAPKEFTSSRWWVRVAGGMGGGAAIAQNCPNNGASPTVSGSTITTGNGGNGADANVKPITPLQYRRSFYGFGGFGGHSGGNGGWAGWMLQGSDFKFQSGTPGAGGKGGPGGDGAPGCILIYY